VWGWSCSDEEGYCTLSAPERYWAEFGCEGPDRSYIFFFPGQLELCMGCGSNVGDVGTCRYVACAADADCPQMPYYVVSNTYHCVDNLCMHETRPQEPVSHLNADALCTAEWPRDPSTWTSRAFLDLSAELDESCPDSGEACILPADCWPPDDYAHPGPPEWGEDEALIVFDE
jgi:hypothetical protein